MKRLKNSLVFVPVFLLSLTIQAQTTANAFLSQLPAVPNSVCNADTSTINRFVAQINKVENGIEAERDKLGVRMNANWEKNKSKMLSANAANLGLSTSDMQKLMNENISEKEGLAIANKSVENQYGTSVEELQKVANMSEAEQQQWAENYANKQMQKAQQKPEATAKKGEKAKRLYDLGIEQKAIADRLSLRWEKVGKAGKNYQHQDSVQSKTLQKKLEPLEKDPVLLGGCATPAEIQRAHALEKQIYNLKMQHCAKMSPILLDYILQYQSALRISFPDYVRLTEIANELSKIQNGLEASPVEASGLGAVDSYADLLLEAYKYRVPKIEN